MAEQQPPEPNCWVQLVVIEIIAARVSTNPRSSHSGLLTRFALAESGKMASTVGNYPSRPQNAPAGMSKPDRLDSGREASQTPPRLREERYPISPTSRLSEDPSLQIIKLHHIKNQLLSLLITSPCLKETKTSSIWLTRDARIMPTHRGMICALHMLLLTAASLYWKRPFYSSRGERHESSRIKAPLTASLLTECAVIHRYIRRLLHDLIKDLALVRICFNRVQGVEMVTVNSLEQSILLLSLRLALSVSRAEITRKKHRNAVNNYAGPTGHTIFCLRTISVSPSSFGKRYARVFRTSHIAHFSGFSVFGLTDSYSWLASLQRSPIQLALPTSPKNVCALMLP